MVSPRNAKNTMNKTMTTQHTDNATGQSPKETATDMNKTFVIDNIQLNLTSDY